MIVIIYWYC